MNSLLTTWYILTCDARPFVAFKHSSCDYKNNFVPQRTDEERQKAAEEERLQLEAEEKKAWEDLQIAEERKAELSQILENERQEAERKQEEAKLEAERAEEERVAEEERYVGINLQSRP